MYLPNGQRATPIEQPTPSYAPVMRPPSRTTVHHRARFDRWRRHRCDQDGRPRGARAATRAAGLETAMSSPPLPPPHPDRPPRRSRQPRPAIALVSVTGNPLVLLWVVFRDGPGCLDGLFWDSTRSSSFPHLGGCIRFGHLQLVPIPADAAFCLVQTVRFVWCSSVRVPESG